MYHTPRTEGYLGNIRLPNTPRFQGYGSHVPLKTRGVFPGICSVSPLTYPSKQGVPPPRRSAARIRAVFPVVLTHAPETMAALATPPLRGQFTSLPWPPPTPSFPGVLASPSGVFPASRVLWIASFGAPPHTGQRHPPDKRQTCWSPLRCVQCPLPRPRPRGAPLRAHARAELPKHAFLPLGGP